MTTPTRVAVLAKAADLDVWATDVCLPPAKAKELTDTAAMLRALAQPAEVGLFKCRACGCHWRKFSDGTWSLASQTPCPRCDNSQEFLSLLEPVAPEQPDAVRDPNLVHRAKLIAVNTGRDWKDEYADLPEVANAVREAERRVIELALQWGCWDRPRWAIERDLEDAVKALAAARGVQSIEQDRPVKLPQDQASLFADLDTFAENMRMDCIEAINAELIDGPLAAGSKPDVALVERIKARIKAIKLPSEMTAAPGAGGGNG